MRSKTGTQIITIHILSNNSKIKDNQAMKFGQFIEYKLKNIVLQKPYTKCVTETSTRPFYIKSKLRVLSLDKKSKVETKVKTTCFYII